MTTTNIGGLTTRVIDDLPEGEKPRVAVILCHGFGAPGDDLAPLGQYMLAMSEKLGPAVRFYFPEGPLGLDSYGMWGARAWWMIDMEAHSRAVMEGVFRDRQRNEQPEGMVEARDLLLALVEEVLADTGLTADRLVLGGFSQGSMLTVDAATRLDTRPAALIAWSGTLLNEDEWRERGARHAGLRVFQSHGRQDPILPYAWGEYLRELMVELGWQVDFLPFDGPHTIPEEGLRRAVTLIEETLAGPVNR